MKSLNILENNFFKLQVSTNGAAVHQLLFKPLNFNIFRLGDFNSVENSGMFPMAPMVNRIKNNRFEFEGNDYFLPTHKLDDKFFLHGDAWLNEWTVESTKLKSNQLTLSMQSSILNCCDYKALIIYTLGDNSFEVSMTITNLSNFRFPFGGGFHPFFTNLKDTKLQFDSKGLWFEGDDYLPTKYVSDIPSLYNFNKLKSSPDIWLNNGYDTYHGCESRIIHNNGLEIDILSPMKYIQIYQPNNQCGFFCIEPQSHWVGAHNDKFSNSLGILNSGDSLNLKMSIQINNKGTR